jgi:glycosyltransferase involved in cell wall biosynthesis
MIKQKIKGTKDIQEAVIKNRVYLAGRVSEDSLQGLLKDCDVILLPITEGGGSNLKTAEAIIADKPIVATTHAFRSYEKFIDELPNIYIADTPEAFQQSILAAVKNKPIVRSQEQKAVAESVLWVSVLEGLADISGGSDG